MLDTVLNTVLDTALERGTGAERRGAVREVRRRPSVLTPDEWRRLLQDPDPRVRILAYDALGTAHDVAQSELSRVDAETDPRVLLAAGESFLKRGHPRGTELLVGRAAAWPPSRDATRLLRSSRADLATLYVELSSADSERRRAAALALAAVDGTADGARSDLAGMLDASDPRESWAARVALASIADRRALDDLEPLSPRHRLELLRHFDDPSSLVALQRLAADRSGPATVRARAARALAKRPADARHLLESLVDCDDVRVSRIARSGLTGAH